MHLHKLIPVFSFTILLILAFHHSPAAAPLATIEEVVKLTASNAANLDQFGNSSAIDGDTIVVGARGEDGGDGDPVNGAGAAYVFYRDQGGPDNWGQVTILHASDLQDQDQFGSSIAISGDTILVAAALEDGGDGDPFDAGGAAYVFERDEGGPDNWGQTAKLSSSDLQAIDNFARSVSIHGDTIVIGARGEDGGPGDPISDSGAAYVFERNEGGPGNWGEVKKLQAGTTQAFDYMGSSVDIHTDTIVVGTAVTRTGGLADDAGMVFVFERDLGGSDNWGEAAALQSSDAQEGDQFGGAVAIDSDTIVAAARLEDGGPGDPLQESGAAYVFERDLGGAGSWGQAAKITSDDPQDLDFFGTDIDMSGDRILIGAFGEDGGPGDPMENAGAAYVFERNQGGTDNWGQTNKLTASDAQEGDVFSAGLGISADNLVISTHFESGGPGDPLTLAGAAYVFEVIVPVLEEVIYLPIILREPPSPP